MTMMIIITLIKNSKYLNYSHKTNSIELIINVRHLSKTKSVSMSSLLLSLSLSILLLLSLLLLYYYYYYYYYHHHHCCGATEGSEQQHNQDLKEIYKGRRILEFITFYHNALHLTTLFTTMHCI